MSEEYRGLHPQFAVLRPLGPNYLQVNAGGKVLISSRRTFGGSRDPLLGRVIANGRGLRKHIEWKTIADGSSGVKANVENPLVTILSGEFLNFSTK
jgi:hypothetical protein